MTFSPPIVFEGKATLTPAKVAVIDNWYIAALSYADTATEIVEKQVYKAIANSMEDVLNLLYKAEEKVVAEVAKEVSKPGRVRRGKLIPLTIIVGGFYVLDRHLKRNAEADPNPNFKPHFNSFEEPKAGMEAPKPQSGGYIHD
jgi:hypothetical protein